MWRSQQCLEQKSSDLPRSACNDGLRDDESLQPGYVSGGSCYAEPGIEKEIYRKAGVCSQLHAVYCRRTERIYGKAGCPHSRRTGWTYRSFESEGCTDFRRAAMLDLSSVLYNPYAKEKKGMIFNPKKVYDFELGKTLDEKVLVKQLLPALERGEKRDLKSMSRIQTVHSEQSSDQRSREDILKDWKKTAS